ncbi:uncharacterized protein LOC132545616 [Ylistrum balloti]|uniref:uncharacterized protein LOC132545616 n=1 Tax=Ylistrum balloti TaxID=509963 RepID=UPI002905DC77|nr:uncharacterized protein LOC132545616 [Ylistrum balloti]
MDPTIPSIFHGFTQNSNSKDESNIMILAKEIQVLILSKLDGLSLARAQKVCRLWYDIVDDFEKYFHVWLRCCLTEISTCDIVEISGLLEIDESDDLILTANNLKKLPTIFWKEVYAEYHRNEFIKNKTKKVLQIEYPKCYGMVTALKLKDNVLFSGHEDGRVISWENIDVGIKDTTLHQHQRMVTDLAVTRAGLTVNHLLLGINNIFVISTSKDSSLILNDMTMGQSTQISYFSKQVNSVSCSGLTFVAAANCSFLQGHPVWDIDYHRKLQANLRCRRDLAGQESTNILSVALHHNKVLASDDIGNLFLYKGTDQVKNTKQDRPVTLGVFGAAVKTILFRDDKAVCLTDDGMLCVSLDLKEFKQHCVYEALNAVPECIAWRVNIFVIGAKTGKVFLYLVKEDADLFNIDLSEPVGVYDTDSEHVNSVAIGDDGNGPVLAISTEHSWITLVRWTR